MNFRNCCECTVCCSGALIGEIFGSQMGLGKKCIFLVQEKCTVYSIRPPVCRNYQCAWTQNILPEWMRPDKCGVLVSVENGKDKQYLKIIELTDCISPEVYDIIETFVKEHDTYYEVVKYENKLGFRPNEN